MPQLAVANLATIANVIDSAFPGSAGQAEVVMLLGRWNIVFNSYAAQGEVFKQTMLNILLDLNSKDGVLSELLQAFIATQRPGIVQALQPFILPVQPPIPRPSWAELANAQLLIDSDPFIDRRDLRDKILPSLLSNGGFPRVVVMTGPRDSGKTYSRKLVRHECRRMLVRHRWFEFDLADPLYVGERDCLTLAREVVEALHYEGLQLARSDTSDLQDTADARITRRIVNKIVYAQQWSRVDPTVLIFDHLDKDVAPSMVEFTEELALAAAEGRLQDMKIVLIGFPRALADFPAGKLLPDTVMQLGPTEIAAYLDEVLQVLNRDLADQHFTDLIEEIFQGQQPPFARDFMLSLPLRVRSVIEKFIEAP